MDVNWEAVLKDSKKAAFAERALRELKSIEHLGTDDLRELLFERLLRGEPTEPLREEIDLLRCIAAWFMIDADDEQLRLFWLWVRVDEEEEEAIQ